MLTKKTILRIKERDDGTLWRTWDGTYGPAATIDVVFADGEEGAVNTKPDTAQKHVDALMKVVGQEHDFDLDPKPDFNGIPQWKVKDYPGKPTGQQREGGGGGRGGGDWESHDERAFKHASIESQVAAKIVGEKGIDSQFEENVMRVAKAIRAAAKELYAGPGYPAKSAAPAASPPQQVQTSTGSQTATPVATPGVAQGPPPPGMSVNAPTETVESPALNEPKPLVEKGQDWDDAFLAALQNHGSVVRLQIAMKKDPQEATVAELIDAALMPVP